MINITEDERVISDNEYLNIIEEICTNNEFLKTKDILHHGLTRYDHNMRVSYFSYKITKFLRLDYVSTARAGLLHDFFLESGSNCKGYERAKLILKHPKLASIKASEYFDLNDKEKDIILTHMFPVSPFIPKYMESWIVDIVDDFVAICEKGYSLRVELAHAMTFLVLIFVNSMKV